MRGTASCPRNEDITKKLLDVSRDKVIKKQTSLFIFSLTTMNITSSFKQLMENFPSKELTPYLLD